MPSWNIHLEAGNRLAEQLHFSPRERKEFLLGCILPDIHNGHLYPAKILKNREETHYLSDIKNHLNFYIKNRSNTNRQNPVFLGYLLHLFLDDYFNHDFYQNVVTQDQYKHLTRGEQRDYKHRDFWLYDANFHHRIGITNAAEAEQLASRANEVPPTELTATDLIEIEKLLMSDELGHARRGKSYSIYNKELLDRLLASAIKEFKKQYLGDDDA